MYARVLNLSELLQKKSHFLLGPRSTGKSFLISQELAKKSLVLDLLEPKTYQRFALETGLLETILLEQKPNIVVIDEIQRIPELLYEVHRCIEKYKIRFLLTGSSARKIKRESHDLLAGRAWIAQLFPLTWFEMKDFSLDRYLRYGGLPHVYPSKTPDEELYQYVQTYLLEEIRQEGIIRKLPPFTRFLKVAGLSSGKIINYTKISQDAQIPQSTVRDYFTILEDTLLGFFLEPWKASKKRKAIATSKFYFFDCGVTHTISQTETLDRNSSLYGDAFEQFLILEVRAYLSYRKKRKPMTFWKTHQDFEVDIVVGDEVGIEIKSAKKVSNRDLNSIRKLDEEKKIKTFYLVSQDEMDRKIENVHCLHWKTFLEKLWKNKIV